MHAGFLYLLQLNFGHFVDVEAETEGGLWRKKALSPTPAMPWSR